MTHYLAQFDCRHGEYSFTETVRFVTDRDPQAFMRDFVASWYGDPDEDGEYFDPGIVSFNGGEIVIEDVFVIKPVSQATFDEASLIHWAHAGPHPLAETEEGGAA